MDMHTYLRRQHTTHYTVTLTSDFDIGVIAFRRPQAIEYTRVLSLVLIAQVVFFLLEHGHTHTERPRQTDKATDATDHRTHASVTAGVGKLVICKHGHCKNLCFYRGTARRDVSVGNVSISTQLHENSS